MADTVAGGTTVANEKVEENKPDQEHVAHAEDQSRLEDLIAQATSKYAVKDYDAAAELYSQATELQSSLNGEMAVENADLLFSYGKALYHVAVGKSDVLGTKTAGEKAGGTSNTANGEVTTSDRTKPEQPSGVKIEPGRTAEEVVTALVADKENLPKVEAAAATQKEKEKTEEKPYFQFTGDENWDDSDDEAAEVEAEGGEAEEEEDDFANAFEVLDLARVLLTKKAELLEEEDSQRNGKGKSKDTQSAASAINAVKNQIADVHDFQAEISFESERWPNAVSDLKASLALKTGLYPQESNILAECHYKLSLALEFASVTQQRDEEGNVKEDVPAVVDEKLREEAAQEMEQAIDSCILRISKETSDLVAAGTGMPENEVKKKRADIEDVKEMVKDMQQRLEDLKKPPISINDPTSTGDPHGATPLNGILGQILGESKDEQNKRLAEASAQAKDISGLVKKKPAKSPSAAVPQGSSNVDTASVNGNGKRQAEEVVEDSSSKKARVDEAT
ncbi:MAG: hypothetical protein Q9227_006636 [Pyrenula ochraceoflavens]